METRRWTGGPETAAEYKRLFWEKTHQQLGDIFRPDIEVPARRAFWSQNYARSLGLRKDAPQPVEKTPTRTARSMPVPPGVSEFPALAHVGGNRYRFGAIGDTHLCSYYERLDVLNEAYDVFEAEGIRLVLHTGNWIDGECRVNTYEVHTVGFDAQLQYMVDRWPVKPGIETWYVAGDDHEGWFQNRLGIEVGRRLEQDAREAGRNDLRYLGYVEHDIVLPGDGTHFLRVMHPGGGSAQALSHTAQRIVESFAVTDVPDVLLIGHYHKSHFTPSYRGCHILQTGCMQDQSPFVRKNKIIPHIGFWTVELELTDEGAVRSILPRWYGGFERSHVNNRFNTRGRAPVNAGG